MSVLLGLAPFIAYFVLARLAGAVPALWVAAAIAVALILRGRLHGQRDVKVLEASAAILFVALAIIATLLHPHWSVIELRLLIDLGLVGVTLGSVLIGRPFTLQYAREQVPQDRWTHPLFIATNRHISLVWAGAFVVETLANATLAWSSTIPVIVPIAVNIAAFAGAIYFTIEYPKRVRARAGTA